MVASTVPADYGRSEAREGWGQPVRLDPSQHHVQVDVSMLRSDGNAHNPLAPRRGWRWQASDRAVQTAGCHPPVPGQRLRFTFPSSSSEMAPWTCVQGLAGVTGSFRGGTGDRNDA